MSKIINDICEDDEDSAVKEVLEGLQDFSIGEANREFELTEEAEEELFSCIEMIFRNLGLDLSYLSYPLFIIILKCFMQSVISMSDWMKEKSISVASKSFLDFEEHVLEYLICVTIKASDKITEILYALLESQSPENLDDDDLNKGFLESKKISKDPSPR